MRATLLACLLLGGSLLWALGRCAQRSDPESNWIDEQARVHESVDQALQAKDLELAEKILLAGIAERAPVGIADEVMALVRKDQLFRLADLYLEQGKPEQALGAVDRGLQISRAPDLFTANLWVARGKALEALEREPEAAAAYHEALTINDGLLHDLLQDD